LISLKLFPIVNQSHIKVFASETSHFSIGTSPYYVHQYAIGIDIYDQLNIHNYEVLSPVSGTVLQIREMRSPKQKFEGAIDKEYLTIIQNPDDENTVFKILHVKPALKVGQEVDPGDLLGETIRNGYFAPWSSPHLHLELKKPQDVLRAKGGINFKLSRQKNTITDKREAITIYDQIPVKIHHICEEFILGRFPNEVYLQIKPFFGLKGTCKNLSFIVDGGIPQYKHGILHLYNNEIIETPQPIYFNNIKIGVLNNLHENYGFVNFTPMKISLSNIPIRGLSLFLARNRPFIKLIPFHENHFNIKENSFQYLKITAT